MFRLLISTLEFNGCRGMVIRSYLDKGNQMNLSVTSYPQSLAMFNFALPLQAHKAPVPEPIEDPLPGEHPVPQEEPVPSPNPEIDDPRHSIFIL